MTQPYWLQLARSPECRLLRGADRVHAIVKRRKPLPVLVDGKPHCSAHAPTYQYLQVQYGPADYVRLEWANGDAAKYTVVAGWPSDRCFFEFCITLTIHPSIHPPTHRPTYSSIHPSIHPSIHGWLKVGTVFGKFCEVTLGSLWDHFGGTSENPKKCDGHITSRSALDHFGVTFGRGPEGP